VNGKLNILPTWNYIKNISVVMLEVFKLFFILVSGFNKKRCWEFYWLSMLLDKIACYGSFFKENNVKVHFSLFGGGTDLVASNMAIELSGGVDVSAHWSNVDTIHIYHALLHDVYFLWGPYYKGVFEKMPLLNKYFIYCGYIYDSTFEKCHLSAKKYRENLNQQGVDFVLSFFDEAYSRNSWLSKYLIEKSYIKLLSLVIDDPKVGLILKPKRLSSLQRIASAKVNSLLDSAVSTKRCIMLKENILPNEAAQASDIAIGLGTFNTAALEAELSGTPCMVIDSDAAKFNGNNKFGFSRGVFDNLDDLLESIDRFRTTRYFADSIKHNDFMKQIDSFQDGNAFKRVGFYLKLLLDNLPITNNREELLRTTSHLYGDKYDINKTVCNIN